MKQEKHPCRYIAPGVRVIEIRSNAMICVSPEFNIPNPFSGNSQEEEW